MAVYQREAWIDAPLADVWEFHSRIDGLVALTPGWMGLRVESVRGPDGEPDPPVLEAGSEIRMAMRPFGVLPGGRWTSRIVARKHTGETAMFRDEMRDGVFRTWRHTHSFEAEDGGTRIRDRVEYQLPIGPLRELSGLAKPFFEPLFSYRHRRTAELLE